MAYWDTEQGGGAPPLLGQIQGTPTLKAFVPERRSARNEKRAVPYEQAREVRELQRFALGLMPDYVEPASDAASLTALLAKAKEWALPVVLVFSDTAGTSSTLKALSAEYRRRLLIGEVKASRHPDAVREYGVASFPTLVGLRDGAGTKEPLRFEGKRPSHFKLDLFLAKLALRSPRTKKPAAAEADAPAGKEKEEL